MKTVFLFALIAPLVFAQSGVTQLTCNNIKCSFNSTCVMSNAQPSTPSCVCPDACDTTVSPVCGSNGVTYTNACVLGVAYCKLQGTVTQLAARACVGLTCGPNTPAGPIQCPPGFVCTQSAATGATPGTTASTCQIAAGAIGHICGPNTPCNSGLVCRYIDGGATTAPSITATGLCFDPTVIRSCTAAQWLSNTYSGPRAPIHQWPVDHRTPFSQIFGVNISGTLRQVILYPQNTTTSIFAQEAVAAFLNAMASNFNFPLTGANVLAKITAAFGTDANMITAYQALQALNKAGGCPLPGVI